jgi:hypothetical protein
VSGSVAVIFIGVIEAVASAKIKGTKGDNHRKHNQNELKHGSSFLEIMFLVFIMAEALTLAAHAKYQWRDYLPTDQCRLVSKTLTDCSACPAGLLVSTAI